MAPTLPGEEQSLGYSCLILPILSEQATQRKHLVNTLQLLLEQHALIITKGALGTLFSPSQSTLPSGNKLVPCCPHP